MIFPNRKALIFLALFLSCFLVTFFILKNNSQEPSILVHPLIHFDRIAFFKSVKMVNADNYQFKEDVYGGVVPHHLYASDLISDFTSRLRRQNPETIILIGPNHKELGNFTALTSKYAWKTETGLVEPDNKIIDELLESNVLRVDENVLPKDHAVAVVMPYFKYYLPNTKVVPILLSGFMKKKEIEILSRQLASYISDKVILVAAVDFSHNLMSPEAKLNDKVTLKLMREKKYDELLDLRNEHLDSPPSIVALLMAMDAEKRNLKVLNNTNSGEMQKNNSVPTTSYFSIIFN